MQLDDLHDDDGVITPENQPPGAIEPVVDPNAPAAPEAPAAPTAPASSVEDAIETFLWDFGIEGGKIQFQDGTVTHFKDLSEAEKLNVLKDLVTNKTISEVERHDLSEEEIEILNLARENKAPLKDIIEELAAARAQEYLSQPDNIVDFDALSADEVYLRFLIEKNPDASDEDLRAELDLAKQGKFYEQTVNGLKQDFATRQEQQIAAYQEEQRQAQINDLEEQRVELVRGIEEINNISGFPVDDKVKNAVLSKLVEVNENNDSLFLEEVFSNPQNLFKAAWLYYNGDNAFDALENQYKRDLQEAYKRGKREALNGLPSTPQVGGVKPNKTTPVTPGNVRQVTKTVDDLHGED